MYKFKRFLILFFAGITLVANGVAASSPEVFSCNLAGPSGLVATNITTSSALISWNAVSGAIGYEIHTLDAASNAVLITPFTTTGTSTTTSPLPAGTEIKVQVMSICSTNEVSNQRSSVLFKTN